MGPDPIHTNTRRLGARRQVAAAFAATAALAGWAAPDPAFPAPVRTGGACSPSARERVAARRPGVVFLATRAEASDRAGQVAACNPRTGGRTVIRVIPSFCGSQGSCATIVPAVRLVHRRGRFVALDAYNSDPDNGGGDSAVLLELGAAAPHLVYCAYCRAESRAPTIIAVEVTARGAMAWLARDDTPANRADELQLLDRRGRRRIDRGRLSALRLGAARLRWRHGGRPRSVRVR